MFMARNADPTAAIWPGSADPMRPYRYEVGRVRRETHDTFSLSLNAAGHERIAPFAPGQFNMLYAFGVGEVAISISADPAQAESLWHTIRTAGTVTRALGRLRKGDMLGVRGPFGTAWPLERARGRDVVIMAGGIGLAPLRPAILDVLHHRTQFGHLNVLYGTRTPADLVYRKELERWRARLDVNVEVTVDRGGDDWRGDVGVVTELVRTASFEPGGSIAMLCGPEIMMRFAARELMKYGMPNSDIYVSLERNMKCAVGFCGHCQYGPAFVCKDGPVIGYDRVEHLMGIREL